MFTLKFYHDKGGIEVCQASRFKVQPSPDADDPTQRVEYEDPIANATCEQFIGPGDFSAMIAENMNGKTTEIIRCEAEQVVSAA